MKSLFLSSILVTNVLQDEFHQEFRPLPRSMTDKVEGLHTQTVFGLFNYHEINFSGVWSPEFDDENLYPLMFRSRESLTRSLVNLLLLSL